MRRVGAAGEGPGGGGPLTSFLSLSLSAEGPLESVMPSSGGHSCVITPPSQPCHGGALGLSNGREVTVCGASCDEKGGELAGGGV